MKQLDTRGRWLRSALPHFLAVALVACGGGGSPDTQTQAAPRSTPVTVYASLADPAGDLCAKRETSADFGVEYCIEPTSSSAGVDGLWAELQKPAGNFIKLTITGMNVNQPPGGAGDQYQGLSSRTFYAGQGLIHQGGETYHAVAMPVTPSGVGDLVYAGATQTMLKISGVNPGAQESVLQAYWTRTIGDISIPGGVELDTWASFFGIRTDWMDAPENPDLVFSGSIVVAAGDNTYQEDVKAQRFSTASCPITLQMNLVSGEIRTMQPVVECADADTGAVFVADINSAKLISKGARIQATKTGSVSYADSSKGVVFEGEALSQVSGGVYGHGAHDLVIHGVTSQGYILIQAIKTN
ncbi:MAG: hypothetical protein HY836_11875 [Aquabacterium sp.]|uniref:hypothetical protein n=1 Tax=Aquabacterium sp. TaxID=1872578 RepID=UPI0025C12D4A|nr:hypothetical protein [Aquabacterium sp.]MBI5926286.1 hypothetical protein [Aquabacterium sp.]